jgi:hypothetical protein
VANSADLRRDLPPALARRFDALGAFVSTVIREIEDRRSLPKERRLTSEVRQDIALLVFPATLRSFLREGTRAARFAAEKAVSLRLSGFIIW